LNVEVSCDVEGCDPGRLRGDARICLKALGLRDGELSVVLTDDDTVRALNKRWRGIDAATDVLSFPEDPRGPVLGDVVISVCTAGRQALEMGVSVHQELRVLLVHGICHLIGHDHFGVEASTAMSQAERGLLDALADERPSLVERAQTTR